MLRVVACEVRPGILLRNDARQPSPVVYHKPADVLLLRDL